MNQDKGHSKRQTMEREWNVTFRDCGDDGRMNPQTAQHNPRYFTKMSLKGLGLHTSISDRRSPQNLGSHVQGPRR